MIEERLGDLGLFQRFARPGWITLEVPHLEAWEKRLCWLTPPQRERIESPEFYQLLQQHVGRKYLAMKPGAG